MIFPLLFSQQTLPIRPAWTEVIKPNHIDSFNLGGTAKKRVQVGNPRMVDGILRFDGAMDGNRQVDPQIAVGGGYVLNGTNLGLAIYTKDGKFVEGVHQDVFNGGIDPKLFYDPNNKVFGFDMWKYWDKPKIKPVNISISATSNPLGAWNTYAVPSPKEVDGGAVGYSGEWVGYSFPGGPDEAFVMNIHDCQAGRPATVYHFAGSLGQPVFSQDRSNDLLFLKIENGNVVITTVGDDGSGTPVIKKVVTALDTAPYFGWPPNSPMKGTDKRTASGDHNPKEVILQSRNLWFSQTVDVDGRASVQWRQLSLTGKTEQFGIISDPVESFIETTLGVNSKKDVLVGFQETGPDMFISPRCAWRKSTDQLGTLRPMINLGTGLAATEGGAWGDYSATVMDGDNRLDLWTIQSGTNLQGHMTTVIAKFPF